MKMRALETLRLRDIQIYSLQSFWPPTSQLGQPSQTKYSTVSSQYIWHPTFSVQRCGIQCVIRCMIQPLHQNVLGGTWKRISLPDI